MTKQTSKPRPPRPTREPEVDSPQRRRLPPLLRRAWFNLNQAFRHRTALSGMTPDQYTVLRTLIERGPNGFTQREIARTMTSDPNTITSLLRRMERSRLVERQPHPEDGRAYRVMVTAAGRRKFAVVRNRAIDLQVQVLSSLPEERREAFLADLEVVAEACQQALRGRGLVAVEFKRHLIL